MATFATIPLDFITGGWLEKVSDAGYAALVRCLALPERRDRRVRHCCVEFNLNRGAWLMSRNKMQETLGAENDRTFRRVLAELGPQPDGINWLNWQRLCDHQNAKTLWSITRPDLFCRTKEDVETEPQPFGWWWPTVATLSLRVVANSHHHILARVRKLELEREREELQRTRTIYARPNRSLPRHQSQRLQFFLLFLTQQQSASAIRWT